MISGSGKSYLVILCFLSINIIFQNKVIASEKNDISQKSPIIETVTEDYKSFYTKKRLLRMGLVFGCNGILANTKIDANFQDWYQNNIRNSQTDDVSKIVKYFGEYEYAIPVTLLAAGTAYLDSNSPISKWGVYATRAYIVGLPPMWLMQVATGGSRPGETDHDSKWRPFHDDNGVSGHAFVGAVPFITLARMNSGNKFLKYSAYLASFLPAWSRVNDDAHYLSQAFLGWYLAWEAADAVYNADKQSKGISVMPLIGDHTYGIVVNGQW